LSRRPIGFRTTGSVLRPSKGNLLLILSEAVPPVGTVVRLKDGKKVGLVRDVIGPKRRPIVVVSVVESSGKELKPSTLLTLASSPDRFYANRHMRRTGR
jgi:rRNA processing protein Gar1